MIWLLKLINPLGAIAKEIAKVRIAAENADTEEKRIEARIQVSQLEHRAQVLIAEQSHPITRLIRPLWAAPFVIYAWKVLVWDMVLGWGTTPPLGTQMYYLMTVIAGAYFLTRGGEKIVKAFR